MVLVAEIMVNIFSLFYLLYKFLVLGYNSCRVGTMYHSNIKILDLSHNNISRISPGFFRPAEISLTHLHLGHNAIIVSTVSLYMHNLYTM